MKRPATFPRGVERGNLVRLAGAGESPVGADRRTRGTIPADVLRTARVHVDGGPLPPDALAPKRTAPLPHAPPALSSTRGSVSSLDGSSPAARIDHGNVFALRLDEFLTA